MPPGVSGGHPRRGLLDSPAEFPDRSLGLGPTPGQRRAANLLPQARPPSKIPDGLCHRCKTPASVSLPVPAILSIGSPPPTTLADLCEEPMHARCGSLRLPTR
ncbi:hypothetical protein EVAR_84140_1 [Eumeta japonica]|uniref:Uncharacterized protein n=1 Tax=Eumeta variegata TaxID=151549 RepID=A0A4C2ADG3_EUMVA|nr:hypothetical protein EVAR_84140_1 [Eumeta japonica]